MRIAQEVVDPISSYSITNDYLRQDRLPHTELQISCLLWPESKLYDVIHPQGWGHLIPKCCHLRAFNEDSGKPLVIPPIGKKFLLCCVRERQMANVMAQGSYSKNATPVPKLVSVVQFR